MNIDERLDRLVERHEALTTRHEALAQTVDLLAIETRELRQVVDKITVAIAQDAEHIHALVRIAEIHERRLTHLEGNEQ